MKTSTALLMIRDGRDAYHDASLDSARSCLVPAFTHEITIDDSDHSLGFGGAIREGWKQALATDAEYVFHLELDFVFKRLIPVGYFIRVLKACPYLVQMALMRQPWNDQEREAGGVAGLIPDLESRALTGFHWLEHARHFTTNPCVYPRWVMERGWPERSESEGHFGIELLRSDPDLRSAYWGDGEEWCIHIGHDRTGTGY